MVKNDVSIEERNGIHEVPTNRRQMTQDKCQTISNPTFIKKENQIYYNTIIRLSAINIFLLINAF